MHSLLIVGCGSIGERHLRCFQKTGRTAVAACELNPTLLRKIAQRYSVQGYSTLDEALEAENFSGMVICTPAHTHLAIARKGASRRLALFIEKPLSVTPEEIEPTRRAVEEGASFCAVAYVYHLMPWVAGARACLQSGRIGQPLQASVTSGQHFPTFRPAYREIYYARPEQGGGAIHDALTHLANAMEWLVGPATSLYADAAHQALEGVTVEDTVTVSARHGSVLVSYAMNQFQAPNETRICIHGERGSIAIESVTRRWGIMLHGAEEWDWHETPPMERDDLFLAQAHAFLDGCEGKPTPLATFAEAEQTLRFSLAAHESVRTGRRLSLV